MATRSRKKSIDVQACVDLLRQAMVDQEFVSELDGLLGDSAMDAAALVAVAHELLASANTTRQRNAANKKHAGTQKARAFVVRLWHAKRSDYKTNIAFSTDASALVLKKYSVSVKPSTIARDWLRGVQSSQSLAVVEGARAHVDGRFVPKKLQHKKPK